MCLIVNMANVAASPPSCPVHITERCSAKTIRRSWSFPSLDLCHIQTNDIIIVGHGACSPSQDTSSGDDSFRSEWLAPVSPGDLWPRLQGYNSPRGLRQVLWESFTRWMFKVADLCFVKCVCATSCCQLPMLQESEDPSLICLWLSFFSTCSQFSDWCPLQEKACGGVMRVWMLSRWTLLLSVCLNQSDQTAASSHAGVFVRRWIQWSNWGGHLLPVMVQMQSSLCVCVCVFP